MRGSHAVDTCENCGGRFDRPGLYDCRVKAHATADLAQKIVAAIERDLCDRRGLKHEFTGCDDDVQYQIRDEWAKIIRRHLNRSR